MIIRPYEEKDKENVRFVCLNSDGPCKLNEKGQHFILTTYCDYFIEQEPENCFVAADENDRAVGYILCAENYDKFLKVFRKEYTSRFKKYNLADRIKSIGASFFQLVHKKEYPAHMHIDILPEYQRMGLGHKLTDALCEHLKKKGIKGINLTMYAGNKKGGGFYRKYGFTLIEDKFSAHVFALKL